ncbi:hypothetical protein D3C81_1707650 [compost metagenome]
MIKQIPRKIPRKRGVKKEQQDLAFLYGFVAVRLIGKNSRYVSFRQIILFSIDVDIDFAGQNHCYLYIFV